MGCFLSTKRRRGGAAATAASAAVKADAHSRSTPEQRRPSPVSIPPSPTDQSAWPAWLVAVAGDALAGWVPRRADSFQKISKIGSGTYSNVYKVREVGSGRVVAMKKVRFEAGEKESVAFMAREISVLRRVGSHPNVVRLEGIATSRVSHALYLVFEYMEHDLAGLAAAPGVRFSEPQVKCYMKQLLSGLEHCHGRGVLHRDIKGSNLLLDNEGVLKIADFGLASTFDPKHKQPMTSRVVTLWYRAPELLLGATHYGVGIDLWSAGCILAELLSGKPIFPGKTEVEQLHRIFKLCGSPSENYWKKSKLPHATIVKPQQPYKRCIAETFKDFPPSALSLVEKLLAIDPAERGTATDALNSEFFTTKPYACEPMSLPKYPPSKEMDVRLREEKLRRQKRVERNGDGEATRRSQVHNRRSRAVPAPEANAELHVNLNRQRFMARVNPVSKSEKFPPPHQDGSVGFPLQDPYKGSMSFVAADASFTSSIFEMNKESRNHRGTNGRKSSSKDKPQIAASNNLMKGLKPSSIGLLMELRRTTKIHRSKGKEELEVFGGGQIKISES
ncbi:probable serine/threonine-protein kinase At1g54610 [Typha angustifolia]|uniref:probable serine/threonine-protein kinase At1g54610 n=1 Tax=Typha angustifolia TaxID=59011 RepID=UPI003C30AA11